LIGIEDLPQLTEVIPTVVESRGYSPVDLGVVRRSSPESLEIYEAIACADLSLCLVDSKSPESQFLLGAVQATFIPSITFTADAQYNYNPQIPKEYQPRIISAADTPGVEKTLHTELELFEEDFVELDKQSEVEAYAGMLVDVASQRGNYEVGTRNFFVQELNMEANTRSRVGTRERSATRPSHMISLRFRIRRSARLTCLHWRPNFRVSEQKQGKKLLSPNMTSP
jgi:hypothetical protein